MEIKAPNSYIGLPKPWVFLAGSIDMGAAPNWQELVVKACPEITFLNPRRDDWDNTWEQSIANDKFRQQVEWELEAMERASLVVFYFAPSSKSPVTMLELGLFHAGAIVCCPEGFWRKGNIDIVCKRYGISQVSTLNILIYEIHRRQVSPALTRLNREEKDGKV